MKTASTTLLAIFLNLLLAFSCLAQDQAQQMENAIQQLKSSGVTLEPRSLAAMYSSAAMLHMQSGNHDKALERVQLSLKLCREHSLKDVSTFALSVAAKIIGKVDDEAASKFLAEQLNAQDASPEYKSEVLKALGQQLQNSGNLVDGLRAQQQRLTMIQKESPGTLEEAQALLDLGRNCLIAGIYDLAFPTLAKAKALAEKLKRPELVAQASFATGVTLSAKGQYAQAEKVLADQLVESEKANERLLMPVILQALARAQICNGRFDAARKTLEKLETQFAGDAMAAYGKSYLAVANFADAIADTKQAPAIKAAVETIARQKQATIDAKNQALAAGSNDDMRLLSTLPERLGMASFQVLLQDFDKATESLKTVDAAIAVQAQGYDKAITFGAMTSDEANVALADQRAGVSELRQQILVKSGKVQEALEEAERHRGKAQTELMRRKLGADTDATDSREMDLKQIVATARELKTTLVVYSLVHALDPDTRSFFAADNPWANPNSIYVWVVSPEGDINFKSVSLGINLSALVELARRDLTRTEDPRDDTSAKKGLTSKDALSELHQLLIDPIVDFLPKDAQQHVSFIPQGALFLVPFAALPDADGMPLVVKHTISTVPSIEVLALSKRQHDAAKRSGKQDILIVGNPSMPSYQSRPDRAPTQLGQLPGAEAEAKYLGELLKVQPLIGDVASETAVVSRMQNARIIHLATHGLLEAESLYMRSTLSAIALGPSEAEDGFLTVRETMRMKLGAELAVLSACDTGRGKISGDGVIGLSRGYIAAGVPSIVVSLWPVSDQATKDLMSSFYQEMLAGADKAAALRAAMLETRKKFPAAKAWAPFTIYGFPH